MSSNGDIWVQWFSCCFHQPQSPRRRHHQQLRIDRSMIGNPTNFVHTVHVGSTEAELSSRHLNAIQSQMQSKGGYDRNSGTLQVSLYQLPCLSININKLQFLPGLLIK